MKKNKLKYTLFSLATCLLFFVLMEGVFTLFFVKPGACDFIERRIIEQGLSKFKPKDEIRIFFYGESTMQGDAYYPKSTIDKWVKVYLDDILREGTSKKIRVFNFGRLGCNSHFIIKSFKETLPYKPDLAVFYTVHNDFVQLDNRHSNFDPKPPKFGDKEFFRDIVRNFVKKSAFLSEINRLNVRLKIERHKRRDAKRKAPEAPAIETWEKFYNPEYDRMDHNSHVFKTILRRWRENLSEIIRAANKKNIPVIFISGISNLKDYHPNESVHVPLLDLSEWQRHYQTAENAYGEGDYKTASLYYQKCIRLDSEYAMSYYRLGQCYERLGFYRRANRCYHLSNDKDRVPFRAPSSVRESYDSLKSLAIHGVSVIDIQEIFEEHSPNKIVDSDLMLDPTHPTIDGQALIALAIAKEMHRATIFPTRWWDWSRLKSIEHLKETFDIDEDFQFQIYLGKAHYIGRFYDKAIEYSQKALNIKPDSTQAKRSLAWAHWRKGDREKAVGLYEELNQTAYSEMSEVFKENPDIMTALISRGRRRTPFLPIF